MDQNKQKHRLYWGIIICLLFPFLAQAQKVIESGKLQDELPVIQEYYFYYSHQGWEVRVYLADQNRYVIQFADSSTEIVDVMDLSRGTYSIREDTIHFKDEILSFTFTALRTDNDLHFLSGFSYLKDLVIERELLSPYESTLEAQFVFAERKMVSSGWEEKLGIAILNRTQYSQFCKHTMQYQCEYAYALTIRPNGSYTWYFQTYPISEGTWTLRGNLLICKDTTLNFNFHCIVVSTYLIQSMLMPGDYQGVSLILKGPKTL